MTPSAPASTSERHAEAPDWDALRSDFPILDQKVNGHPLVYFDNAASSQKPRCVLDAVRRYYEHDNANVHRGIHELSNRATEAYEGARARAARFLNARSASEIVFTRGTTESINLVAAAWGSDRLKPGDTVLLSELEHHSNLVPWQMAARRTGARLAYIPIAGDTGELDTDRLDALLRQGPRILALTHVSNSLGVINPVAEICRKAREAGVVTLIDAAQSAGHLPLDVQAIGCDFLALSGHKICGPTGIGVLYGRQEILKDMAPYQGGGEMISKVDWFETVYNVAPHRFEAGTPHISGAVGLGAAMDYLDSIGRQQIFDHDQELADYAVGRLAEFEGIRIFGPRAGRAGLVSFVLPGAHALDVATLADQRGVALRAGHHCNQPLMGRLGVPATLRASFYFYNQRTEIDRFIEVLRHVRSML